MRLWPFRFVGWGGLSNPDVGVQSSGDESYATEAEIAVTDERAMKLSTFWGGVRLMTQTGGTLPLGLFRRAADGAREPLDRDHPVRSLLHTRPNQFMNPKEFRQAIWMQRVVWGNAYCRLDYNGAGDVSSILPLLARHVTVERLHDGVRFRYHMSGSDKKEFWNRPGEPPEMFHWRGFSPDGVIGLSPLAHARYTLGLSVAAEQYSGRGFSGRPMGVIYTDERLTPDQQKKLREHYGKADGSSAVSGDGKWWTLPPGWKYQPMGMPPDDLQMLESRQFQVQDVARFLGVPAVLLDGGQGGGAAWPASYEKQMLAFKTVTLKPLMDELEDKIVEALGGDEDIEADHDLRDLLRPDSETLSRIHASGLQNGYLTRNEVRHVLKMPPSDQEGADKLTVQLNMTALEDLPDLEESQGDTPNAQ